MYLKRVIEHVKASLAAASDALAKLQDDQNALRAVAQAGELLAGVFKAGGRVYSCGNGGSMCDAMHFAEELSGRFRQDRAPLAASAMSDPTHLTCVGNDFGYEHVFSRFVEAHGRKGDALLAISTSGSSKNVLLAAETAKKLGVKVIALTGRPDAKLAAFADIHIATPAKTPYADRVQELHIKVIHTLIELCERALFPANYK